MIRDSRPIRHTTANAVYLNVFVDGGAAGNNVVVLAEMLGVEHFADQVNVGIGRPHVIRINRKQVLCPPALLLLSIRGRGGGWQEEVDQL